MFPPVFPLILEPSLIRVKRGSKRKEEFGIDPTLLVGINPTLLVGINPTMDMEIGADL